VSSLRSENADLRAKLEDSKTQLQSNEQMIRWLNQQVSDDQGWWARGTRNADTVKPGCWKAWQWTRSLTLSTLTPHSPTYL
jgi:hypothetical protein